MPTLNYSNNFYSNFQKNRDLLAGIELVESFNAVTPNKIKKVLIENKISIDEIEWQASFTGKYNIKILGPSSVGIFLINSHYLVYSTNNEALNSKQLVNPFGFCFFPSNITVTLDDSLKAIIVKTPYEKFLVAEGSSTLESDFKVLKELIRTNIDDRKMTLEKINDDSLKAKSTLTEKNEFVMDNVDKRFQTNNYIISNNYIPKGFVYKKPIVVSASQNLVLGNYISPHLGYIKAYEQCIEAIKDEINQGSINAVFNLQHNTHYLEGSYEIIMFGDGVVINRDNLTRRNSLE